jgi:hypothetical protein
MRFLPLSILVVAAGCSLIYPLDYRTAVPDVPAPDAAPDVPAPDVPASDGPAMDAPAMDAPAMDAPDESQPGCPMGFDRCSGVACTDLRTNSSHCGRCGNVCALSNATPTCEGGACIVASCNPGFADCDMNPANGCEVSTATSLTHCGRCGNACPTAGGTPVCREGVCRVSMCEPGFADCDGNNGNGCEADTRTSLTHCGGCGSPCARPNASARCVAGACTMASCNAGFGDCDNNPANGCETPLATDVRHCGTCGRACSSAGGTPSCAAGVCAIACAMDRGNCDMNVANGCETNTRNTFAHCGGCGRACSAGQNCNASACGTTCAPGETSCGGTCANLQTSTSHCGMCGFACPTPPNTVATCTAGACGIECLAGFGNCNGNTADGCETPLATSPAHCARCNNVCPTAPNAAATCSGSVCGIACAPGFANCDNAAGNGCEVTLASTLAHCGACGRACMTPRATPVCRAGACAIESCNSGFGDCNGSAADGCETPLDSTLAHCGGCNRMCAPPNAIAVCSSAECRVRACNTGFADCNDDPRDGCEVTLATSTEHCGRCDNRCPSGASCVGGACCGTQGLPCCLPGNTCGGAGADLRCIDGRCVGPCGGEGLPCCVGGGCNVGLECGNGTVDRTCGRCGGSNEPCCRFGVPCRTAATCPMMTMRCP